MSESARQNTRKRKLKSELESIHRRVDVGFIIFLVCSPLALGGTHPLAAAALATVAMGFAGMDLGLRIIAGDRVRAPAILWGVIVLGVFALFRQTTMASFLNVHLVDIGYQLWPEVSARGTASPGRTSLWLWKLLGAGAAMYYAANRFRRSDHIWKLGISAVGAAMLTAVIGIIQESFGVERILGVYVPIDWGQLYALAGPYVNPNQAGSLAALGAITAFCGAHHQDRWAYRIGWGAAGLFLACYAYMTTATAACGALALALVILLCNALLTAKQERNTRAFRTISGVLSMVLAVGAVMMIWFVLPPELFAEKSAQKIILWRQSVDVVVQAPWAGFGAATFQDIFPYVDQVQRHEVARNVESAPIQFAIEHGLIVFIATLGLLGSLYFRTIRDRRIAKRFLFPSVVAISSFILIDSSIGMSLQGEAHLLIVATFIGGIAGRPAEVGAAVTQRKEGWVAVGAMAAIAVLSVWSLPSSIQTSLDDSRIPYGEVSSQKEARTALREEATSRPLNIVVLIQTVGLRIAIDQVEMAQRVGSFLTSHAPNRQETWEAAFRLGSYTKAESNRCDMLKIYWNEFEEIPREIASDLVDRPETVDCLMTMPTDKRCALLSEVLSSLNQDARFLLVQKLLTEDRSQCVLRFAVDVATGSAFEPLARMWTAELEDFSSLTATTHEVLADYYDGQQAYQKAHAHYIEAYTASSGDPLLGMKLLATWLKLAEQGKVSTHWYTEYIELAERTHLQVIDSDSKSRKVRKLIGAGAFVAEDYERARGIFDGLRNIGSKGQRAEAYMYLGDIARTQSRFRDAINAYRMVLRHRPKSRAAKKTLKELNATIE